MKLLVKKTFCPRCQRLVKGKETSVNGIAQVLCSICNKPIWSYNRIYWTRL